MYTAFGKQIFSLSVLSTNFCLFESLKFKMEDVAMVTKVQKLLNLFQTSRNFTVMFLVTCRFANRDIKFQNGCS
jgi:hypothetical protein